MKASARFAAKWLGIAGAVLLAAGIAAPYLSGNRFAPRIRSALEAALGRKVELGPVHFSLFTGPGFSVENVVIHENPAMGIEPIAYVGSLEAVPRLTSLFGGRLEFASIRLEDASINLAKSGPPSEPGRWNFEPLLSASVIRAIPEVHVRSGRINFKFGDTKSVFYLMNTDLDIAPPARGSSEWSVDFSGEPARTDKPARGFGDFSASGHWVQAAGGRLDLDVRLEKSAVGEMIALLHGYNAGIHGTVSARMHLSGPPENIRISGSMEVDDVHRWDLMPPHGQGWPFSLAGRLNIPAQTLELQSSSAGSEALPLRVQFRCANYLSQPRWGAALNWNGFPIGPLLDVARHMGADLPPGLKMTGNLDGVLGYSGQGSLQGALDFHNASIAIPNSPPLRAAEARLIFDRGHARVSPTQIRTARDEEALVQADYNWEAQDLNLTISTDAMRLDSLREQAALAAVPWLEQVPSGSWKGQLAYHFCNSEAAGCTPRNGWTGNIELHGARFPLPGLADAVEMQSAAVRIDGPRVVIDRIRAKAGDIAFQGEYRYEPQAPHPHRLRIWIPEANAGAIEQLLMPSLHRKRGLLARALSLGRTPVPEWLSRYHVDAAVQIGSLVLSGIEMHGVQGHLLWDVTKAELDNLRARVDGGKITGKLQVNLRGNRPAYRLQAQCRGIEWKSGRIDGVTVLESNGTGAELLANLHASGDFAAHGLDMDALPELESVAGSYELAWADSAPRLRFSDLQVVSAGETYTGQGVTQPDGRLLIQLASGTREMRMSGTLAELRLEQPQIR